MLVEIYLYFAGGEEVTVDYRDLGIRIRKKREKQNMSQADLAARVQLSTQHISNVENAKSKIGLDKLVSVANALGCSVDELICGSMKSSREIYQCEITALLEEFSDVELRAMPEYLKYLKYSYTLMKNSIREESDR